MVTAARAEFRAGQERSPYTAGRLDWLSSHLDRSAYCDEAAVEADGPAGDILAFVAWGMDCECREVFDLGRARPGEIAAGEEAEPDD
jgi:hypothetical protein